MGKPRTSLIQGKQYGELIFLGLGERPEESRGHRGYKRRVKCIHCGKVWAIYSDYDVKRNKRGCRSCASKGRPLQGRVIRRYGVALKRAFEVYQKDMDFPTVFHILIEEGVV